MILYVDDSDNLITVIQKDESTSSIFKRSQKAATAYQSVVHQTGGAVRPDKCRLCSIQFQWKKDKWSYLKNHKTDTLQIMDINHIAQPIQQLSVDQGWKDLGILLSDEGNWNDHTKYLIDVKIIPWNNTISTLYLHKHDIYHAAATSIFKTVDYSLTATSVTTKQCHQINVQLHKKCIPKIGVDVHLSLVYRNAPIKYQGLNSLHTEDK